MLQMNGDTGHGTRLWGMFLELESESDEEKMCYDERRDIVIPPLLPGNFGVTHTERKQLAFFHGTIQPYFKVRSQLNDLYGDGKDAELDVGGGVGWDEYQEMLANHKFCLTPPGHAQWSLRFIEAISAGCVPVTFQEKNNLPWSNRIDYSKMLVNVSPHNVHKLKDTLKAISAEKYQAMQKYLQDHRLYFLWEVEGEGTSAFSMLTEELRTKADLFPPDLAKKPMANTSMMVASAHA